MQLIYRDAVAEDDLSPTVYVVMDRPWNEEGHSEKNQGKAYLEIFLWHFLQDKRRIFHAVGLGSGFGICREKSFVDSLWKDLVNVVGFE